MYERRFSAIASRSEVKNSLTEKCENCTIWWPALSTTAMRLEHADITASSVFSGRQSGLNIGVAVAPNRTAKISASSSTRRGRMETVRHRRSRWVYSRFSLSTPNSVCSYVSSKLSGRSSSTLRMLAGKVRHSLSIWQTTHRNLQDHVSVGSEAYGER